MPAEHSLPAPLQAVFPSQDGATHWTPDGKWGLTPHPFDPDRWYLLDSDGVGTSYPLQSHHVAYLVGTLNGEGIESYDQWYHRWEYYGDRA